MFCSFTSLLLWAAVAVTHRDFLLHLVNSDTFISTEMVSCCFPKRLCGIRLMSTHLIWYIICLAFTSRKRPWRSNCHNSCRCPSTTATVRSLVRCSDSSGSAESSTAQKNHQKQTAPPGRPQVNTPDPLSTHKTVAHFEVCDKAIAKLNSGLKARASLSNQCQVEGNKLKHHEKLLLNQKKVWAENICLLVSPWCYLAVRASRREAMSGTIRVCSVTLTTAQQ